MSRSGMHTAWHHCHTTQLATVNVQVMLAVACFRVDRSCHALCLHVPCNAVVLRVVPYHQDFDVKMYWLS